MLRQTAILDMFARSPIRPLQQHMEKAHACVALLPQFFHAVEQNDWQKAAELQAEIRKRENEADDLKRNVRSHLPKGLFLPVSRTDILNLLSGQDRLADTAKDIAGIMLGRKMRLPESLVNDFNQFLQRSIDAADQAKKAINELDELLESGFRGKEVLVVDNMVKELDQIETQTDKIQIALRQSLFDIEKDMPPIDVIFLYKIIELIGTLADRAQQAGSYLRMLVAR